MSHTRNEEFKEQESASVKKSVFTLETCQQHSVNNSVAKADPQSISTEPRTNSRKELEEKKNHADEVMPPEISKIFDGYSGIQNIIYEYSFDADPAWFKNPVTFFGIPSSEKQILALALHSGPLDQIESYIRMAHARKESHLPSTFVQAIRMAVIGLNQTIESEHTENYKAIGMAEKLLELHAELLPNTYQLALEQASLAASFEDENKIKSRLSLHLAAVNQVFDAFKQPDEKKAAAIETFKEFIRNAKPQVMINNRYHLNLLHLVVIAFYVLIKRGGELPRIGEEKYDGFNGVLADRFCIEIIGAIQKEFPARIRQILRNGLYNFLLHPPKEKERTLDLTGLEFLRRHDSDKELGVNSYYDDFSLARYATTSYSAYAWRDGGALPRFQNLLREITISASKIYSSPSLHSPKF